MRNRLAERVAREDYKTRVRNARDRAYDRSRDYRSIPGDLARARERTRTLDSDLALDVARGLAYDVARTLDGFDLEQTEVSSLLLSSLIKPESVFAGVFADLFLAAALALEQQAGNIPPLLAGIALVRRKVK